MLDYQQVACFVSVAREQSFTRAAEKLSMSQPWLSTQVKKLEARLGFPLFQRTTRQVRLTSEGERLFAAASGVVQGHLELDRLARALQHERAETVTIGIPAYSHAVPEHIEILEQALLDRPDLSIQTVEGDTATLLRLLEDGEADVAFVAGEPDSQYLEIIPLRLLEEVLVVPAGHILAAFDVVPAEALAGVALAVPARQSHPVIHNRLAAVMAAGAELVELPELQMPMRVLLAARLGLPTVVPRCVAEAHEKLTPGLVIRPCLALRQDGCFHLVRRKGPAPAGVRAFWRSALAWSARRGSDARLT